MIDLFRYPETPGAQDRDTSQAAADQIAPTAPQLRARALAVVERSNGLTADEVAGRLGLSILSIRPRLTELAHLGKVRDGGGPPEEQKRAKGNRLGSGVPGSPARTAPVSPAAEQACRFVQLVAQAQPHAGNALDEMIVTTAQKIAAEIRREQFQTSRSGVPLTRKA